MNKLFDSVDECVKEVECVVKGELPSWIDGTLIRIGPGKWDFGKFTMNHWFDGSAILVKFRIENGRIFYSSRFLNSDAYKRLTVVQKPVFTEFGTRSYPDPCKNVFSRFFSQIVPSDLTDNDISNIYQLEDELYVATESCNIWQIDPKSLDAIEKINLDKLIGVNVASSHPHHCPAEGFTYNLGSSFLTGMRYHIVRIPSSDKSPNANGNSSKYKNASIVATIPSSSKTCFSYCHSFGITDNYIILIEQPLLVNGFKLATCTPKGKAMEDCLEWYPDEPTRFHVVEKATGNRLPMAYHGKALFFFHVINAYEEDDQIVLDVVCYEDPLILEKFELNRLRSNNWDSSCTPAAKRFVLPLDKKEFEKNKNLVQINHCEATAAKISNTLIWLTPESLGPTGFELPVINYKCYNGKKYRYVYGSGVFERGFYCNSICKLDVKTKKVQIWKETETSYPGEALFISKPGATEEDDGIVLSLVLESDPVKSHYLLALNAKTFAEIARGYVKRSDCDVPTTIHGLFLK